MLFKKELYLKNNLIVLVLIVSVIICLTACVFNNSNSNNNASEGKTENSEDFSIPLNKREDNTTIRVCQRQKAPESLDPIQFDNKTDEITFHIFDRLLKWDHEGHIISDLAEYPVQINDKTLQFKLKKGIKFHNGEPFDAQAVKFSIERILNSPSAQLFETISKVEIVDPYTINIVTSKPDYLLIRKLTLLQILPKKYFNDVGAEKFGKHPIGTGAFKFDKWNKEGSLILSRNENYWREKKPPLKTIVFKFITYGPSKKQLLESLFKGEVDLITDLPGFYSLKVQKNPNTKIIKMTNLAKVHKLVFNSLKQPFSDIRVRKAVNIALNRDILIKVLEKGNGRKIATNSVKLEFGHNPNLKPYKYDLQEARKLLKEAGINKLNIKIAVTEDTELIAKAITKDLHRINITSDYDVMKIGELSGRLKESKKTGQWDYDLTIYSGVDPFMHVGFLYEIAVYSEGLISKTNNKQFNEVFKQLKITLDDKKQKELCHKLEELAYNNYWYTPVFQVISTYGAANDLVLQDSAMSFIDLKDAYFKRAK